MSYAGIGFQVAETKPDGDCVLHCFLAALPHDAIDRDSKSLRQLYIDHLVNIIITSDDANEIAMHISESHLFEAFDLCSMSEEKREELITMVSKHFLTTWFGEAQIDMLAKYFNVSVVIVNIPSVHSRPQAFKENPLIADADLKRASAGWKSWRFTIINPDAPQTTIFAYNGSHYNVIIPPHLPASFSSALRYRLVRLLFRCCDQAASWSKLGDHLRDLLLWPLE